MNFDATRSVSVAAVPKPGAVSAFSAPDLSREAVSVSNHPHKLEPKFRRPLLKFSSCYRLFLLYAPPRAKGLMMWKILLLMLGLASSAAHAERLDTLKTFTGIWAPAGAAPPSVACEKELSSGGDRTPSEARPYELLGICERGIDYLYQPVNCDATNITPHRTSVEFDERCCDNTITRWPKTVIRE
jgi:hypothetical protein